MAPFNLTTRVLFVLCLAVIQSLAHSQQTSKVFECPVGKIRALDADVKNSCAHVESGDPRDKCIAIAFAERNKSVLDYSFTATKLSLDKRSRLACITLVDLLDRGPAQCKNTDEKPKDPNSEVVYFFLESREVAACGPNENFVVPCEAKLFLGISGLSLWKFGNVADRKSIHTKIKELTGSEKLAKTHSARVTRIVRSPTFRGGSLMVGFGMLSWLGAEAVIHADEKNSNAMALFEGVCKDD